MIASFFALLQRLREGVENRLFALGARRNGFELALRILAYPYAVLRDLAGGQLTLRATGLVYATLLALIPALALTFSLLKAFGIHRDLAPLIHEFFRPLGASSVDITARVLAFADNVRGGLVGTVGFVLLLWTLIGTVKRVEDSFNYVWRVQVARSFGRRIAEYVALLLAAPILIATVVGFTGVAVDSVARHTGDLPLMLRFTAFLVAVAPYAIVTVLFTALYIVIPNTRVRLVPALIGAVCAGLLWAAVGRAFTQLVIYTSRLTLVYAGFAVIVAMLLWTYLGWLILLAGAQLAFYVQNPSYLALGLAPVHLSNREKERVALNLMLLAARDWQAGAPHLTLGALAQTTGLPPIALSPVFETLEAAGLILLGRREQVRLAREPAEIRLSDILAAVRQRRRGHRLLHIEPQGAVGALEQEIETALERQLGDRTLAELVAAG
ncbi:MAG: YhjD/YihY/BrkB family envelope integrity protein [Steroidobacteraceae bacterium]